jgi:hypothetical protein
MNSYDFELGGKAQTDTRKLLNKTYGFENDVTILKKFEQSKVRQEPGKQFPAPQVPPNFDLMHKFAGLGVTEDERAQSAVRATAKDSSMNSYLKSVSERAELLDEKPIQPESVFDLLNKESREFLKQKQLAVMQQQKAKLSEQELKEKREKRYELYVSYVKKNFAGLISLSIN